MHNPTDETKRPNLQLEKMFDPNLHDITQRIAAEQQDELKSRFVSMASHEFRTPLATILSSVSLVAKYAEIGDKPKQLAHIDKIKSSVQDLTNILDDFLSVTKLEEGKIEANATRLDITEFIQEVIQEVTPLRKEDQLVEYKHSGEHLVRLDPELLKNVLYNLLSNAMKFSAEGSSIQVTTERRSDLLGLKINDNGIGIPSADQKHLFQRFFRASNATHIQGTGLGLNIVSKYVELMHGTVDFTSSPGEGTMFSLTFPQ
jgi:signal transduction histidine kinase